MSTAARRHTRPAEPDLPADYLRLVDGARLLVGIDLSHYRPAQMERRLRAFAERQGCRDLDAYLVLLRRDAGARVAFLDRMTINVSELFRNPERFEELERDLLPDLVARGRGSVRAWSAGCSYGAEPYTLSLILQELAPGGRHEITASDLDRGILARARQGRFSAQDVRGVPEDRRVRWLDRVDAGAGGGWQVTQGLRAPIRFAHHDLLQDRYPERLDLIACRNVVIYFTEAAKTRIYEGFHAALRPGGVLFVGPTERINRWEEIGWERVGTSFYRRPRAC